MSRSRRTAAIVPAVLLALAPDLASCADAENWWNGGCGRGPLPEAPWDVNEGGGHAYIAPAAFDDAKTVYDSDDGRPLYPVDRLLLFVERRTRREHVDAIARSVGGRVVGQIPDQCTYQLQVRTRTAAEQKALINRLMQWPRVAAATGDVLSYGERFGLISNCLNWRRNDAGLTRCEEDARLRHPDWFPR